MSSEPQGGPAGRRAAALLLLALLLPGVARVAGAARRPRVHAAKTPRTPPAAPAPASASTFGDTSSPLVQAIDREVRAALKGTAALGVHVVDLATGNTLYGYNPDDPRTIASNTKLVTTAAALEGLGPGFFFETRFVLRGTVQDGVLTGDLGVVGGGDPNLSGRSF